MIALDLDKDEFTVMEIAASPMDSTIRSRGDIVTSSERSAGDRLIARGLCKVVTCPCPFRCQKIAATETGIEALRAAQKNRLS